MAPSESMLPISNAAERPTGVSEIWRNAERRFNAASGISICRNRSPGASTLRWLPTTKSATLVLCPPPSAFQIVQMPSSADVSEIIGPARQRHAEIAADGRGLPYLEGGEIGPAASVDQGCCEPFRRACQRVQLRHRAGCCDREMTV